MSSKDRKLQLLSSRHMPASQKQFRCGERILESGIYRVMHRKHRLPHEVTLLRDELFPRCIKCEDEVFFQLLRCAPEIMFAPFKVALYALPVADEADEADEAESDFIAS